MARKVLLLIIVHLMGLNSVSNFSHLPIDTKYKIYDYLSPKDAKDSLMRLTRDAHSHYFMMRYQESFKVLRDFRLNLLTVLKPNQYTTKFQTRMAYQFLRELLFGQNLIYDELFQLKLPGIIKLIQNVTSSEERNKILSQLWGMNMLPVIAADFWQENEVFDDEELVTDKIKTILCLLRFSSRALLAPVSCLIVDGSQLQINEVQIRDITIRQRLIHPDYPWLDLNLPNETEIAVRRICFGYFYRFMWDENREELIQIDPALIEKFGIIPWKRGAIDNMISMSMRDIAGDDEEKLIEIIFQLWLIMTRTTDADCFGKALHSYDQNADKPETSASTKRLLIYAMHQLVMDGHLAFDAGFVSKRNESNMVRKAVIDNVFPCLLKEMLPEKAKYAKVIGIISEMIKIGNCSQGNFQHRAGIRCPHCGYYPFYFFNGLTLKSV